MTKKLNSARGRWPWWLGGGGIDFPHGDIGLGPGIRAPFWWSVRSWRRVVGDRVADVELGHDVSEDLGAFVGVGALFTRDEVVCRACGAGGFGADAAQARAVDGGAGGVEHRFLRDRGRVGTGRSAHDESESDAENAEDPHLSQAWVTLKLI